MVKDRLLRIEKIIRGNTNRLVSLRDGRTITPEEIASQIAALYEPKPDENRLLNEDELDKLAEEYPCLDFSFEDDYKEEVTIMRQAQRDLTARIVAEEILEEINECRHPTNCYQEDGSIVWKAGDIIINQKWWQALKARYLKEKE